MPSMMNRPQRTRGRHCYCFACTGDRGDQRAAEKRRWQAEAESELTAEEAAHEFNMNNAISILFGETRPK